MRWYFWITSRGVLYRGIVTTHARFRDYFLSFSRAVSQPISSPPAPVAAPRAARGHRAARRSSEPCLLPSHPPGSGVYLSPCLLLEGGGCSTVWLPSISTTHLVFSSSSARRGGTGLQPAGGPAPLSPHPLGSPLTSPVHGPDPDGHFHLGVRHLSPTVCAGRPRSAAPRGANVHAGPGRGGGRGGGGGEGGGEGGGGRAAAQPQSPPRSAGSGTACRQHRLHNRRRRPANPGRHHPPRVRRGGAEQHRKKPSAFGTGSGATTPLLKLLPKEGERTEKRPSSAPPRRNKGRSGACAGGTGSRALRLSLTLPARHVTLAGGAVLLSPHPLKGAAPIAPSFLVFVRMRCGVVCDPPRCASP